MTDDPFDRAVQREQELRDRLAAGAIDDEEADALRDLFEATGDEVRLTIDQAQRLVDEGADPSAVAELVRSFPRMSLDDAIQLAADYGLERDGVRDIVRAGAGPSLDVKMLTAIWDYDVSPELLELVREAGFDDVVASAITLTEEVDDPAGLLRQLHRYEIEGLTHRQLRAIADNELKPRVIRRVLDGDPDLDLDGAIRFLLDDDGTADGGSYDVFARG